MRKSSLWSNVVFEKEVIFHEFDLRAPKYLEFEVSKSSVSKHTTFCGKGVFTFIVISKLHRPLELKFSQVCYFMHNVIHQVARLVFDNYQCPVSLSCSGSLGCNTLLIWKLLGFYFIKLYSFVWDDGMVTFFRCVKNGHPNSKEWPFTWW